MAKRRYIDLTPLLNNPAWFKEAFTDRGDGKTTAMIKVAIESRLKTGLTPVFCRRWGSEMGDQFKRDVMNKIRQFMPEFFNDRNLIWKGNIKKGGLFLVEKDGKDSVPPYLHAFPLTMAGKMKSGLDVSTHRNLYIDEYVPLDGRYIKNEPEIILELYRTLDRDAILTSHPYLNYVLVCGNRTGKMPATDIYFGVDHNYAQNALKTYKDGSLCILTYSNSGHTEKVLQSKLHALIKGTPYDEYALGGQLRATKPQIWQKPSALHNAPRFAIKGENGVCYAYTLTNALILCSANAGGITAPALTIDPTDHSGHLWIKRMERLPQLMRSYFAVGHVYFDHAKTAEKYSDVVNYLSRL